MRSKRYTLQEIADHLSAEVRGERSYIVSSLSTLASAKPDQLSFVANPRYRQHLETTNAGAVIIAPEDKSYYSGNAIVCDDPYLAYAKVSRMFERSVIDSAGISEYATVDSSAVVSNSACIAPGVRLAADCVIGDNVVIGANSVIGEGCKVGHGTIIHPNVTLYYEVIIGNGCIVHSGAVIGADGFGFAKNGAKWDKISQLGGVKIGDNVEIGACTTIDRGALDDTVIEDGVILDNQIQIAHNVNIGRNTAIAACTAVAGSTKIGAQCTIAGACGITGHITIAEGTHVTAMSIITKSITKAGVYSSGTGMLPNKQWKKNVVRFRQLDDLARRIKSIEDKITDIKGS